MRIFHREVQVGDHYLSHFVNPENKQLYEEAFGRALLGESTHRVIHYPRQTAEFWFDYNVFPLFDDAQQVKGVILSIKDITKEQILRNKLQDSEHRYRQTFQTAPVSVIIFDQYLSIMEVNLEAIQLFGYSHEEIVGQSLYLLIPERFQQVHHGHTRQYLENPRHIRMGYGRNTMARTKSGNEIIVDISLSAFQIGGESFVTAIIQDITQQIENERKIKLQMEKLTAIARNQSHEVRHSLSKIQGLILLVRHETPNLPTYFNDLEESAEQLEQQIQEIIDLVYQ